jgi:hypothetical protein
MQPVHSDRPGGDFHRRRITRTDIPGLAMGTVKARARTRKTPVRPKLIVTDSLLTLIQMMEVRP